MSEYIRVRDYRTLQLLDMPNVEVFRESRLSAGDVFDIAADHVAIATGARWRSERFDLETFRSVATGAAAARVLTPDDIMDGKLPDGPTLVFDSDGYYMGGVIAERLRAAGLDVTLCASSDSVAPWGSNTFERWRVRSRLMELGVNIETAQTVTAFDGHAAVLECAYSGDSWRLPVKHVVMVTARKPNDTLFHDIRAHAGSAGLPFTLTRIGDCEAPAIIAAAVHAGHRYARELEAEVDLDLPLRHERIDFAAEPTATAPALPRLEQIE